MLTIKEIAQQLGISVTRARLCIMSSGTGPMAKAGRTHLYDESILSTVRFWDSTLQKRKRNAKPTASTQTESTGTEPEQGSQATLPPIDPVADDTQTLPESSPDM